MVEKREENLHRYKNVFNKSHLLPSKESKTSLGTNINHILLVVSKSFFRYLYLSSCYFAFDISLKRLGNGGEFLCFTNKISLYRLLKKVMLFRIVFLGTEL